MSVPGPGSCVAAQCAPPSVLVYCSQQRTAPGRVLSPIGCAVPGGQSSAWVSTSVRKTVCASSGLTRKPACPTCAAGTGTGSECQVAPPSSVRRSAAGCPCWMPRASVS